MHPPAATDEDGKEKKGCCDDDYEVISIDDAETVPQFALPLLVALVPEWPQPNYAPPLLPARTRKSGKLEYYRPPPLIIDVPRAWQVFRI